MEPAKFKQKTGVFHYFSLIVTAVHHLNEKRTGFFKIANLLPLIPILA